MKKIKVISSIVLVLAMLCTVCFAGVLNVNAAQRAEIKGVGYDYTKDGFYKNKVYATWVNVWYGSSESWYDGQDKNSEYAHKVKVNGKDGYITPDNSDLYYRKEVFKQAKEAGINTLIMDLTNGDSSWQPQSKSYQRMCWEAGMKFAVAINAKISLNDMATTINKRCQNIWNLYANLGEVFYSSAYLYKDGKPLIVLYCNKTEYDAAVAATGEYRDKFTFVWASGEESASDKWGWQLVPQDGPQASSESMFVTPSISWNAPYVCNDSWRKSLAWLDFNFLAAKENSPKYTIVGMIDDFSERNGWMKADTSNVSYIIPEREGGTTEIGRGIQMRDIYGDVSEDAYYNRVTAWIAGEAGAYNEGGILADGAYTLANNSTGKLFGVARPEACEVPSNPCLDAATDVGAAFYAGENLSTEMEKYYWFYHLGNNEYRIVKLTSGLSLTYSGDALVQQYDENNDAQRWVVSLNSDGTYKIVNKATGKAITDAAASNNAITLAVSDSSATQKWNVSAVSKRTFSSATTVINDGSSSKIIDNVQGGLNLLGVETGIENGRTKLEVKGFNGNDPVSQLTISIPEVSRNFTGVTDIQFDIENTSDHPIAFTWLNNVLNSISIQQNDEWVEGYSYLNPSSGAWTDENGFAWTKLYDGYNIIIPANYSGSVRMGIQAADYRENIGLSLVIPTDCKPTIYFDNLCVVSGSEKTVEGIEGSWSSPEYGFWNLNYGENGVINIGTPSDILNNMYYKFDKPIDLSKVKSINFYIENNIGLPLAFKDVAVKAAVSTNDNWGIIDADDGQIESFFNNYPGVFWKLEHDYALNPIKISEDGNVWENADTTTISPDASVLTIPVGFRGYVSIPLSEKERMYDDGTARYSNGIGLVIDSGYKDGVNTPAMTDYAGKSFTINNITAVTENEGLAGNWRSVEYQFYGMKYSADGTATIKYAASDPHEKMFFKFQEEQDLYKKGNLTFKFKNETGCPLTFYDASIKAAVTTLDNKEIVDNVADFYDQNNLQNFLWSLGHDFNKYPFYIRESGSADWVLADTDNYGMDSRSVLTIPEDFDGEIMLPIGEEEQLYSDGTHRLSNGIALCFSTGNPDLGLETSYLQDTSMIISDINLSTVGDATGDGVFNILDLIRAKKLSVNFDYSEKVDFDEDGNVSAADIIGMKKYLLIR